MKVAANVLRFCFIAFLYCCGTTTFADVLDPIPPQFKTSSDLSGNANSLFTVKKLGAAKTIYGLYLPQLAYTTTDCNSAIVLYTSTNVAGAMYSSRLMPTNESVSVGKNYLYNMLYTAIYYNNQNSFSSSVCTLPGCSWFTDISPPIKWCVYVGAIAPNPPITGTNVAPYGQAISGAGYNYDAVNSYQYIGPISCNDSTLECSLDSAQEQTIP